MILSENYKNRLKILAGLKPLNEDMHPQFFSFGFYDMANGLTDALLEMLEKTPIKHSYDPYRNFITIETDNPKEVLPYLEEARIYKLELSDSMHLFDEPNDCVLVRAATSPNPSPGAMM